MHSKTTVLTLPPLPSFPPPLPPLLPTVSSPRYKKIKSAVLAIFSGNCQGDLASKMQLFMSTLVREAGISMLALKAWIRREKASEGEGLKWPAEGSVC